MRVLVLGGTRFIGAAAVRALLARGHEPSVFSRGQAAGPPLPAGVPALRGERGALAEHHAALRATRPEAILDMRCLTAGDAEALLALARACGVGRVVAASSCDVYRAFGLVLGSEQGPLEPVPLREDAALRARRYPYRRATPRAADDPDRWQDEYDKLDVEERLLGAGDVAAGVVRLPMVHGPWDYRRRVSTWLRRMSPDRPALVLPAEQAAWRPCRGFVDDAGLALALACERGARGVWHVADPPLAEREWVEAIARAAGWPGRVRVVPAAELPPALRPGPGRLEQQLDLDSARARAELGWAPTPLAAALEATVAWERAAPAAPRSPEEQARDAAEAAWVAAPSGPD